MPPLQQKHVADNPRIFFKVVPSRPPLGSDVTVPPEESELYLFAGESLSEARGCN